MYTYAQTRHWNWGYRGVKIRCVKLHAVVELTHSIVFNVTSGVSDEEKLFLGNRYRWHHGCFTQCISFEELRNLLTPWNAWLNEW